jgi:hypothetical protein
LAQGQHALECSANAFQTWAGYFGNTSSSANVMPADPSLRRYTALDRFKQDSARMRGPEGIDLSRADRLRDAIGVYQTNSTVARVPIRRPSEEAVPNSESVGTPLAAAPLRAINAPATGSSSAASARRTKRSSQLARLPLPRIKSRFAESTRPSAPSTLAIDSSVHRIPVTP